MINTGAQPFVVNFRRVNKQFSFLGVSLVYDKSNQYITVFDSYNIELASTKIKTLILENVSNTYSIFNGVKFDTGDKHDRYLLYRQLGYVMVVVSRHLLMTQIITYLKNYLVKNTFLPI